MHETIGTSDQIAIQSGKGLSQNLHISGHYRMELIGPDGVVKEIREGENTVTTAGKTGVAAQIATTPGVPKWGWIAIGTGTPSGTLLGAEVARVAFTSNTSATNVDTVVATFGAGTGTGAITEAGTFDVVTANTVNMWTSSSFSVVNKSVNDSLQITWSITVN